MEPKYYVSRVTLKTGRSFERVLTAKPNEKWKNGAWVTFPANIAHEHSLEVRVDEIAAFEVKPSFEALNNNNYRGAFVDPQDQYAGTLRARN